MGIYIVKNPNLPQFRFEWHPTSKKVYVVLIGRKPEIGEPIALDIETQGDAVNSMLIWSRGYKTALGQIPSLTEPKRLGVPNGG